MPIEPSKSQADREDSSIKKDKKKSREEAQRRAGEKFRKTVLSAPSKIAAGAGEIIGSAVGGAVKGYTKSSGKKSSSKDKSNSKNTSDKEGASKKSSTARSLTQPKNKTRQKVKDKVSKVKNRYGITT